MRVGASRPTIFVVILVVVLGAFVPEVQAFVRSGTTARRRTTQKDPIRCTRNGTNHGRYSRSSGRYHDPSWGSLNDSWRKRRTMIPSDDEPQAQTNPEPTPNETATPSILFDSSSSRRQWLASCLSVASSCLLPHPATAAGTTLPDNMPLSSLSLCDPSVSIWKLPSSSASPSPRLLYLLGTAHISESSAELARQLVLDTHPQAVMVELDLRRVAGKNSLQKQFVATSSTSTSSSSLDDNNNKPIVPNRLYLTSPSMASAGTSSDSLGGSSSSVSPVSRIVVPRITPPPLPSEDTTLSLVPASPTLPEQPQVVASSPAITDNNNKDAVTTTPSSRRSTPGSGWFNPTNFGAAVAGQAIKSMYQSLGKAGFQPGQEFANALDAGQVVGADLVLGDQDVQVTLQRLSLALQATDWQRVQDFAQQQQQEQNDDDSTLSLAAELWGSDSRSKKGDATTSSSSSSNSEFQQELAAYVETLKSRSTIRTMMQELQTVAPALVQVMVTERDAYMATVLDSLSEYPVLVAVVGMAHQDGIERNLQAVGWNPVPLPPSCRRRSTTVSS